MIPTLGYLEPFGKAFRRSRPSTQKPAPEAGAWWAVDRALRLGRSLESVPDIGCWHQKLCSQEIEWSSDLQQSECGPNTNSHKQMPEQSDAFQADIRTVTESLKTLNPKPKTLHPKPSTLNEALC